MAPRADEVFWAHGNDLHDDGRYPQPLEQSRADPAGFFTRSSIANPLRFFDSMKKNWLTSPMSSLGAEFVRTLVSATPLALIFIADAYCFGPAGLHLDTAAGFLIQLAVIVLAALIMVPIVAVRLVCTVLLFIVAILGSFSVGLFYLPAVCIGLGLTIYQAKTKATIRNVS